MAMGQDDLSEMLEAIDMETYLDVEGIDYKLTHGSSGTQLNVKECPVCGSRKWKVYLNADTGVGNCFAGDHPPDENFSKWSFIKAHTGLERGRDVVDHIRQIAREFGWAGRRVKPKAVQLERPNLTIPESFPLPIKGRNLKYLSDRNIDVDTAAYFHLHFSSNGAFHYQDPSDGKFKFQDYSNRVIIPIFDLDGSLVSFQGRDVVGKSDQKYLFPPGYASTGRYLYNAHNVKGLEQVVMGEGAFDVMAIKIAMDEELALRNVGVVGSFGKHLSHSNQEGADQIGVFVALRAHGLKLVTIMWDGEKSATKAALDAAARLVAIGLNVRIAILPDGKDPNEVAPSVVRQAYWKAIPFNKLNALRLRAAMS